MPAPVLMRGGAFHHVDELVAELDKGIARPLRSQGEVEDLAVKGKGLIDVADFERNVVDADEARLALIGCSGLGHACPPSWSMRSQTTIYYFTVVAGFG